MQSFNSSKKKKGLDAYHLMNAPWLSVNFLWDKKVRSLCEWIQYSAALFLHWCHDKCQTFFGARSSITTLFLQTANLITVAFTQKCYVWRALCNPTHRDVKSREHYRHRVMGTVVQLTRAVVLLYVIPVHPTQRQTCKPLLVSEAQWGAFRSDDIKGAMKTKHKLV